MPTFEFHIRQKHPGKYPPGLQVRPGYLLSVKAETVDEAVDRLQRHPNFDSEKHQIESVLEVWEPTQE